MTPQIKATPDPATAGDQVDLSGTGFTKGVVIGITTVDDVCVEVGGTSFRPKRDGSFANGTTVPRRRGFYEIHAKVKGVVVAKFRGTAV